MHLQNLGTIGVRNKVTWGMDLSLGRGERLFPLQRVLVACGCLTSLLLIKVWRCEIFFFLVWGYEIFFFLFSSSFLETRVSSFSGNPLQSAIHQRGLIFILKSRFLRLRDWLHFWNCSVNTIRTIVMDQICPHLTLCCPSWRWKYFHCSKMYVYVW